MSMWGALVCKCAKNQKPVESRGGGGGRAWLSFGVYGKALVQYVVKATNKLLAIACPRHCSSIKEDRSLRFL